MKTMTCKQLGGACDLEFHGETFEEMAEQSKNHGTKMFHEGDEPHLKAMNAMQELMHSPNGMKDWFEVKKQLFNSLPDNR